MMEGMEKMEEADKDMDTEEAKMREGEYIVNVKDGYATFPSEVDKLGKIQVPSWILKRLDVWRKSVEVDVRMEIRR